MVKRLKDFKSHEVWKLNSFLTSTAPLYAWYTKEFIEPGPTEGYVKMALPKPIRVEDSGLLSQALNNLTDVGKMGYGEALHQLVNTQLSINLAGEKDSKTNLTAEYISHQAIKGRERRLSFSPMPRKASKTI